MVKLYGSTTLMRYNRDAKKNRAMSWEIARLPARHTLKGAAASNVTLAEDAIHTEPRFR